MNEDVMNAIKKAREELKKELCYCKCNPKPPRKWKCKNCHKIEKVMGK